MKNDKHEVIKFKNGAMVLDVDVNMDKRTVWLSLEQMSLLFNKDKSTISRHIRNVFKEGELNENSAVAKNATPLKLMDPRTGKLRITPTLITYYNLDVIISVGYRVHSKQGIVFRKWATGVLDDYLIKGYAVNEKRLSALNKTVEIQSKMLADTLDIDSNDILKVVTEYANALSLLDDYDHQVLKKPKGRKKALSLSYEESRELINTMNSTFQSDVFGIEKEPGQLAGILSVIDQTALGKEVYPTLEEKAANLLYFLIKDHPFADGCKRIGAALFLKYLDKNNFLFQNGIKTISDSALVAMTLLIAESDPKEKEIMISLVMNFLK